MSLYIDISEFLCNPITTGIQRIAGELCRHLPANSAIPVRHYQGQYVAFSAALTRAIGLYFREPGQIGAAEIRRLGAPEMGKPVRIMLRDTVLVPEVIIEPARLAFLNSMPVQQMRQHRFIVYDLLPITHPEFFWSSWLLEIGQYYKVLRGSTCPAFISRETRDAFYGRLKRTSVRDGLVLPLGCDSLGPRPDKPRLNSTLTFSVLGTVEPRKNHQLILEAFEPLLGKMNGLQLRFIGKMGWVHGDFTQKVHRLASDPRSGFKFEDSAGDDAIRKYIEESRATIYVSTAEGYGLPPVESLWAGTPVIASRAIPSLNGRGPEGIHFIDPLTAGELRKAVLAFSDESYANQKRAEAASIDLPTWESFADDVLKWCLNG